MHKNALKIIFLFYFSCFAFAESEKIDIKKDGSEVLGYWVGYDDTTNVKNSVIYVYKYNDKVYGRILNVIKNGKVYDVDNPSNSKVVGFEHLTIEGLDFMWGLKYVESAGKWDKGKIIDPNNGKIYTSEMRVDPKTGNLITKGKVWIFGRSKIWTRAREDEIPELDVESIVPNPPVAEK
ncbi:DUF2147 domain-containing protein [Borrelia anserina]|uniref:DUF2147 domain-containing protein n=2 Tax=Borrelia anserina TaxID=143 RepID=W5SNH1_BORAN|nr:DUF2147 domain-containing protein [Borrelia anserina]AHH08744.1 Hypothetical protein BAN_0037900 [Borrelia anserina BA2]APR65195.1 hypothetical protein N187_03855 [Borrelia anserina Es]UPA07119.1 DUF2147 domain-containing protein [Borrelia anserina]